MLQDLLFYMHLHAFLSLAQHILSVTGQFTWRSPSWWYWLPPRQSCPPISACTPPEQRRRHHYLWVLLFSMLLVVGMLLLCHHSFQLWWFWGRGTWLWSSQNRKVHSALIWRVSFTRGGAYWSTIGIRKSGHFGREGSWKRAILGKEGAYILSDQIGEGGFT